MSENWSAITKIMKDSFSLVYFPSERNFEISLKRNSAGLGRRNGLSRWKRIASRRAVENISRKESTDLSRGMNVTTRGIAMPAAKET